MGRRLDTPGVASKAGGELPRLGITSGREGLDSLGEGAIPQTGGTLGGDGSSSDGNPHGSGGAGSRWQMGGSILEVVVGLRYLLP